MPIQWLGFYHALKATIQPTMGSVHRIFCILIIARIRGAFIESHDDIRTNNPLNINRFFWREQVFTAIDMGVELYALFR